MSGTPTFLTAAMCTSQPVPIGTDAGVDVCTKFRGAFKPGENYDTGREKDDLEPLAIETV